jgi:hypothetical protein
MGNDSSKNLQAKGNDHESTNSDSKVSRPKAADRSDSNNNNVFVFESTISSDSLILPTDKEITVENKTKLGKNVASDLDIQDLDESFEEEQANKPC